MAKYNINGVVVMPLDFGEDITQWNVYPIHLNTKQEWMENKFTPIHQSIYDSLRIKSEVIADQKQNKSKYNLLVNDILCIKMYTDTNDLQYHFRKAFRSNSNDDRREQFVHWAIEFNIIFLKVEVLNIMHGYNDNFCNKTLYHGLSHLFYTNGLVKQFNGLLSTTWERNKAHEFAGDGGMILQIDKTVNNKNMNALSVEWISCHNEEREILLMNPSIMIQRCFVFSRDMDA
eukprot:237441_1